MDQRDRNKRQRSTWRETVTNISGLFTRVEFTIAAKKSNVLFLLPDADVTMATTTEGVAERRHHVCVLTRLHIVRLPTQARDARMNLRSTMCNYCRQITGAALHDY